MRINWNRPVFSDNSGLGVSFSSSRQSGSLFTVPGTYEIVYTASDPFNNKNNNCSFRITLKSKFCSYLRYKIFSTVSRTANTHIKNFSFQVSLFYLSSFSEISFMALRLF